MNTLMTQKINAVMTGKTAEDTFLKDGTLVRPENTPTPIH